MMVAVTITTAPGFGALPGPYALLGRLAAETFTLRPTPRMDDAANRLLVDQDTPVFHGVEDRLLPIAETAVVAVSLRIGRSTAFMRRAAGCRQEIHGRPTGVAPGYDAPDICRQRGRSSLQRLFQTHLPELLTRYEVEFASRLGRSRCVPIWNAKQPLPILQRQGLRSVSLLFPETHPAVRRVRERGALF
jgi:hypothetical protein